jgi:O-antigen/teichoic acid export membrane protein
MGFLGSAIGLPTGIVTAAFLSRQLGPEQYGILTVVCTIVFLMETTATLGFERAAVKLTAETVQWENTAAGVIRVQLITCIVLAALITLCAPLISNWMQTDALAFYLRVYAIGIPIAGLARIHKSIMVGLGYFKERAWLDGGYWIVRLFLVFIFVLARPTVTAVLYANIVSMGSVLFATRHVVRLPIFVMRRVSGLEGVWGTAWPLYLFTICIILTQRMDLIFVKANAGPDVSGFYAAAKNLSIVPGMVAAALTPVLLSKLSFLLADNRKDEARSLLKRSRRFVVCLLPFAGMSAGAAAEVVALVYGKVFLPAAPLLAVLIFGALGLTLTQVNAAGLISAGRSRLPLGFMAPILPVAIAAYDQLIGLHGAISAAAVTAAVSGVTAVLTSLSVNHVWGRFHSTGLWAGSFTLSGVVFCFSIMWPTPGWLVVVKLVTLSTGIVAFFWISGEFKTLWKGWAK